MKRIVSVVLISALLLTGCRQTPENSADSKLYVSINGENLQGIKEVVQKKLSKRRMLTWKIWI